MICETCYEKPATERHHLFEDTKINRKLYKKLLDHKLNIQMLCYGCHHGHNGEVLHISEKEFCNLLGIETRSKCGKL
jgi:hypothetical protein